MPACIVYSSRTGNTRAVAKYLAGRFSLPMFSVENAPDDGYDEMILGFWTWRGGPDPAMRSFMETLRGKKVFFLEPWPRFPILRTPRVASRERGTCSRAGIVACWGIFYVRGGLIPTRWPEARIPARRNAWLVSGRPRRIRISKTSARRNNVCVSPSRRKGLSRPFRRFL